MRVVAIISLQKKMLPKDVSWDHLLGNRTILQHVVDNCRTCPAIDEIAIATDLDTIKDQIEGPISVVRLPSNLAHHAFNFLNVTLGRLAMETYYAREIGFESDVIAFLPWNMPLLKARSLESLYHSLLEDMVAARIVPTHPVDPGLHTRFPGENTFFPVWHAPAVDRQRVPQLFRPAPACFSHQKRIFNGVPLVRGLPLPRHEQLVIGSLEHLEFAKYFIKNIANS